MRRLLPPALLFAFALPTFAAGPSREGAALFTPPAGWTRTSDDQGTRFISPDKTASFSFGHAAAADSPAKALDAVLEEPKKLPQYREELRQPGGDHNASGGTWAGAVYSYADTPRNAYAYVWVAVLHAGGRALPVIASFANQKAYNTHGNTIAKVINDLTLTTTILERGPAGAPPLTRFALDETVDFLEWLMQTPFTSAQKTTVESELRSYWKTANKKEIDGITELLSARDQLAAMKPAERDLARQAILAPALTEWRNDATSPSAKMLVTIYDNGHQPISPATGGSPALTRQAVDAFAEFLFFAAAQAAGVPETTPAPELKAQLADEVAKSYPTLDKEQRDLIASMPLTWAALRVAWPDLPATDKAQTVAAWKNTPSLVALGNALKPADPPAPAAVGVSAGTSNTPGTAAASSAQSTLMSNQMRLQMQQRQFQMMQTMFINQHNHNLIMSSNLGGNNSYQYRW
jgi:hypothetical protein